MAKRTFFHGAGGVVVRPRWSASTGKTEECEDLPLQQLQPPLLLRSCRLEPPDAPPPALKPNTAAGPTETSRGFDKYLRKRNSGEKNAQVSTGDSFLTASRDTQNLTDAQRRYWNVFSLLGGSEHNVPHDAAALYDHRTNPSKSKKELKVVRQTKAIDGGH